MLELLLIALVGGAIVNAVSGGSDSSDAKPSGDNGEPPAPSSTGTLTDAEREEASAVLRNDHE